MQILDQGCYLALVGRVREEPHDPRLVDYHRGGDPYEALFPANPTGLPLEMQTCVPGNNSLPYFVKDSVETETRRVICMFKNYIKSALRNLFKHKGYSLINIVGLAIGMASCLLILIYVRHELSYDSFHEKADRIYRIGMSARWGGRDFDIAVQAVGARRRVAARVVVVFAREVVGHLGAGLEVLRQQPQSDSKRIAAIGYCFGGATVQQLAYTGADLRGVVSFHGQPIPPEEGAAERVKASILICHGAADPFIGPEKIQAYLTSMEATGLQYMLVAYSGAKHGFTNPDADKKGMAALGYNRSADAHSWAHMKLFFEEALQ